MVSGVVGVRLARVCVGPRGWLGREPTNGGGPRVVAFEDRLRIASHGEVPERLNGRDWKSRNGG
jgi:hypothetical protein